MKLFRNKQTGEMYICLTHSKSVLSLISIHDESLTTSVGEAMDNYEEIDTAPTRPEPVEMTYEFRKTEQIMFKEIQDNLNGDEPLKDTFSIGDILYVPVQGYESPVPFEIVHVCEDTRSIYFMSRDILAVMQLTEAYEWLEAFKSKLPPELVDCLKPVEHVNVNGTHSKLISLPSIRNMGKDEEQCTGADDIKFDKFKIESNRCKGFKGETAWYWSDTPNVSFGENFWFVISYGGLSHNPGNGQIGVCPIFKLSKDK